jgi:hypothetical protein
MAKKPIFHWMQAPYSEKDNVPIPFASNFSGKFGKLQGELDWRLNDFCRIHQIVYKEINFIEAKLDEIEIEPFTDNIDDPENILTARKLNYVHGKNMENDRVVSFVDHMTVVGLWAIGEQFLGKIFKAYISEKNGVPIESVRAPYRWDDFVREYLNAGIDLSTCENYDNANECRVLNNAIKHDPIVTNRLTSFPYFVSFVNSELEKVPLEMQRYVNGVSDFLGSLIENANKNVP